MSEDRAAYGDPSSIVELLRFHPGARRNMARYPGGRTAVHLDDPLAQPDPWSTGGRWRAPGIGLAGGDTPEEAIREALDVLRRSIESLERELRRAES